MVTANHFSFYHDPYYEVRYEYIAFLRSMNVLYGNELFIVLPILLARSANQDVLVIMAYNAFLVT